MQSIMNLVGERKKDLSEHPFYTWVESDNVSLEDKLTFAPIMVNFVMNFRDINRWFLRFPNGGANEFEKIINGNTFEDETHSRLYLEDWQKLNLDQRLDWRASDMLWWMFLADDTEPFRRFGMKFSRMSVADGGDAFVRFAHSEAGEACGNDFFEVLAPAAARVEAKTNIRYRYFGHHHLDREKGHVIKSEGVFENQVLTDAQRNKSLLLANEMFDIFFEMHDVFLRYAETYVNRGLVPQRKDVSTDRRIAPPPIRPFINEMAPGHAEVRRALDARKQKTAAHPFFAWLRDEQSVNPKEKLQRFIPLWAMDILGYRDLNHYVLRYDKPQTPEELIINRWVEALETHSPLFLNDWDALDMDSVLGWGARDTIKFLFLDAGTDVHRHNISKFIKLGFGHQNPVLRYWFMEALESSGDAFFQNTRALASKVEQETNVRLDYLGDRHNGAHAESKHEPVRISLPGELSAEDRDIALTMVDTVFNAVDEQLHVSLDAVRSNKFNVGKAAPDVLSDLSPDLRSNNIPVGGFGSDSYEARI
jgi:hypothetical protein